MAQISRVLPSGLKKDAGEIRQRALEKQKKDRAAQLEAESQQKMLFGGTASSASTREMRRELENRGVPSMDEASMVAFAKRMGKEVDHMFPGKDQSGVWFRMFKEVRCHLCC